MRLRFAYNTNGIQNHRLEDAIALVADAGYDGVALTLDIHHLDPYAPQLPRRAREVADMLRARELGCVIETGARFLLDARAKHEPTLVSPEPAGRAKRIDFLRRALAVGEICGAEAVSFWAGVPRDGVDREEAWGWLRDGVQTVANEAARRGVVAALEPEPGMLVETLDDYVALRDEVGGLRLALDLGHCLVTGERDPADAVREFAEDIGTVAIEDMRRGEHVHLPFGEGDLDLDAVLGALHEVAVDRLVCVELSRDSHRAHELVPAALGTLRG